MTNDRSRIDHIDVPVKPVCPNEPRERDRLFVEKLVAMSSPIPPNLFGIARAASSSLLPSAQDADAVIAAPLRII